MATFCTLDRNRDECVASMLGTRGPPDQERSTWLNKDLSDSSQPLISRIITAEITSDRWTLRMIAIVGSKSNGRIKRHASSSTHLDPSSKIERMQYDRIISIDGLVIATVDRDPSLHPTAAPNSSSFKFSSLRRKNWPVDFHQIRLVYFIISRAVCFPVLLMHFRTH